MIPLSPLFVLAGTCFYGSGFVLRSLMTSELLRVYENDEVQGKILITGIVYGVGEMIGPLLVKLFEKIDFRLGGIHFTFCNIPSLVLIGLTIVRIIASYFFVHDVSLIHDLSTS